MKRLISLLMLLLCSMLVACGVGNNDAKEPAKNEASTLSLTGLSYLEKGAVDAFEIEGKIESNYALEKIECEANVISQALEGVSLSDTADAYICEEGITTLELNTMVDYFVNQYEALYDLYSATAGVIGADDTVDVTLDCTCYDVSGKTVNFTISYSVISDNNDGISSNNEEKEDKKDTTEAPLENGESTLAITGLAYPEKGVADAFELEGKIESNYVLDKIQCTVSMEDNASGLSVNDEPDAYIFEKDTKKVDLKAIEEYFVTQCVSISDLYNAAATQSTGKEIPLIMKCICYDVTGKTVEFTIHYKVVTE